MRKKCKIYSNFAINATKKTYRNCCYVIDVKLSHTFHAFFLDPLFSSENIYLEIVIIGFPPV